MVFGFPGSFGLTHWQYTIDMQFGLLSYQIPKILVLLILDMQIQSLVCNRAEMWTVLNTHLL